MFTHLQQVKSVAMTDSAQLEARESPKQAKWKLASTCHQNKIVCCLLLVATKLVAATLLLAVHMRYTTW